MAYFSLVLVLCFVVAIKSEDVCNGTYITIQDVRRSTAYKYNATRGDVMICDKVIINESLWYSFDSEAGNAMPTTAPKYYQ